MSGGRLERWIDAGLVRSPLQPWFRRRSSRSLAVLAYHGVEDPACFARHLDWLSEHANPIALEDLLSAIDNDAALPEQSVLITFDDGDRSVLEHGLPLLRKRGLSAIVFVVTGLIGTSRPPWWIEVRDLMAAGGRTERFPEVDGRRLVRILKRVPDEQRVATIEELRENARDPGQMHDQLQAEDLRRMEAEGLAIGNHTHTHPCLPRCPETKVADEVETAHKTLEEILGSPCRAFAYPNGDVDPRTARVLQDLGYRAAFLFDHRLCPMPAPDPLAISRVRVNSDTSLDRFRAIVSGLHPALHHARGGS